MSAPEKIWYEPKYGVATEEPQNFDDAEYIRYDIHLAALKQAREKIRRYEEALEHYARDITLHGSVAREALSPPSDGGEGGERK